MLVTDGAEKVIVEVTGEGGWVQKEEVESGSWMGEGSLGRCGLMISFFILVRGTKDSPPDTESSNPSNSLDLTRPGELKDMGLNLVEGPIFSL